MPASNWRHGPAESTIVLNAIRQLRAWKYPTSGEFGDARGDPDAAQSHAFDVVVDDDVVLANDANSARAALVVANEEVGFDEAAVAVAEREHAGAVEEGVVPVDVVARLAGDDFQFAVAAIEEVVLDDRA